MTLQHPKQRTFTPLHTDTLNSILGSTIVAPHNLLPQRLATLGTRALKLKKMQKQGTFMPLHTDTLNSFSWNIMRLIN
jgi:hypothetical protein